MKTLLIIVLLAAVVFLLVSPDSVPVITITVGGKTVTQVAPASVPQAVPIAVPEQAPTAQAINPASPAGGWVAVPVATEVRPTAVPPAPAPTVHPALKVYLPMPMKK